MVDPVLTQLAKNRLSSRRIQGRIKPESKNLNVKILNEEEFLKIVK